MTPWLAKTAFLMQPHSLGVFLGLKPASSLSQKISKAEINRADANSVKAKVKKLG